MKRHIRPLVKRMGFNSKRILTTVKLKISRGEDKNNGKYKSVMATRRNNPEAKGNLLRNPADKRRRYQTAVNGG
jgi:hypothetical protein